MTHELSQDLSEDLQRIYARRFDGQRSYRERVWKVLVSDYFQQFIPAKASVLDLGCGYGQFINNVRAEKKYAIDLNPRSRQALEPGIAFFEQDCAARWPLENGSLDVVFSSNFFEHLPAKSSLDSTIREAGRCLKKGGLIAAMGPNVRYLAGNYWDFWDHHIPITELSLGEALETNGFRVERAIPRFLPYTMVNQRELPMWLVSAYLKIPAVWPLFGHQFLVLARKEEALLNHH